jgi:hypothetical protein
MTNVSRLTSPAAECFASADRLSSAHGADEFFAEPGAACWNGPGHHHTQEPYAAGGKEQARGPAPVGGEAAAADRRAELKWSGKRDQEGGEQARHEQGVAAPFGELSIVGLIAHAARNMGEAFEQTNLYVRPVVEVDGHEAGARFAIVRRADGVWIEDRRRNPNSFSEPCAFPRALRPRTGTSPGRCREGGEPPSLPSEP